MVTHTLMPVLGRQKQSGLCELEASLIYIVRSKAVSTI